MASVRSSLPVLRSFLLLSGQNQQPGIGRQHLANRILELSPGLDPAPYVLSRLHGDAIHVSFPVDHIGQGKSAVPFAADAATVRLPAAGISLRQDPGELIGQARQTAKNFKLALAQALGQSRAWFLPHLEVIVLQGIKYGKGSIFESENRSPPAMPTVQRYLRGQPQSFGHGRSTYAKAT